MSIDLIQDNAANNDPNGKEEETENVSYLDESQEEDNHSVRIYKGGDT